MVGKTTRDQWSKSEAVFTLSFVWIVHMRNGFVNFSFESGKCNKRKIRMSRFLYLTVLFVASVHGQHEGNPGNVRSSAFFKKFPSSRQGEYTANVQPYRSARSPAVEVMMHLPEPFRDVASFRKFLNIKPERIIREIEDGKRLKRKIPPESLRSYGFSQIVPSDIIKISDRRNRRKREAEAEAEVPDSQTVESRSLKIENDPSISTAVQEEEFQDKLIEPFPQTVFDFGELVGRPVYTTFPDGTVDSPMDQDDPRKRRNTSANDHDESSQRDKRTYMDGGVDNRESTTTPPFWKRKKDSPPFVTGRDGRAQKGNGYIPPQHRSGENARESHSMKDLDKSVQSNEIPRSNQDNYFASTNRRAYNSRQAENFNPSTPKSVYDTIDYTNSRRNQEGRSQFGRNSDNTKDNYDRSRPNYEQLSRQYAYPRVYDRYYYPYPYPGDVYGRGIEYYHRTYDPSNGRIIYYANMPDNVRYDPNLRDPTGRSYYVNGRTYIYDPYARSYVLPYEYRYDAYGRPLDYSRYGRGSSESYSGQYYGGDKIARDARYESRYDKVDRYKDEVRNKTYVIFDAEDNRSPYPKVPYAQDINRYGYPAPPVIPPTQVPYRQLPAPPPTVYPAYPYRNPYYPVVPPTPWSQNQRPLVGITDPNFVSRPHNSPDVQLPLSTSNRQLSPTGSYDKLKKV